MNQNELKQIPSDPYNVDILNSFNYPNATTPTVTDTKKRIALLLKKEL